jgi:hypothetical protein
VQDCVIIGNGASRLKYNLDLITVPKFGCNTIYRTDCVDYLVAQDMPVLQRMSDECVDQPIWVSDRMHRRLGTSWQGLTLHSIHMPYIRMNQWFSGEQAMVLAAQLGFKILLLIGFDGGTHSLTRDTAMHDDLAPTAQRYSKTFTTILEYYPDIKINICVDNPFGPNDV